MGQSREVAVYQLITAGTVEAGLAFLHFSDSVGQDT